jgi:hypothetical protein
MAITARSHTGGLTAATVVAAFPSRFHGLTVNASNTGGASTITVYDNASAASGTILWQKTIATQTAANTQTYNLPVSLQTRNGMTISVATTAVGAITFWVS